MLQSFSLRFVSIASRGRLSLLTAVSLFKYVFLCESSVANMDFKLQHVKFIARERK